MRPARVFGLAVWLIAVIGATADPAPAAQPVTAAPVRTYGISLLGAPVTAAGLPQFSVRQPGRAERRRGSRSAPSARSTASTPSSCVAHPAADATRVWDTLLKANPDEAETAYGLLAQVIELPADHMGVAFELRPEAKFNDGTPVTAEDVVWTFETLRDKGRPFYRQYYADVAEVKVAGPRRGGVRLQIR